MDDSLTPVETTQNNQNQMTLSPTLAALGDQSKKAMDRISAMGFRHVQLSATQPGLRPRELDRSARRDLAATLRRRELNLSGLDLWLPAEHLTDPQHCDRAVNTVVEAIKLAADLGRCPVSLNLPRFDDDESSISDVIQQIIHTAQFCEVELADHAAPLGVIDGVGVGIDPAMLLGLGIDPSQAVYETHSRIQSARLVDLLNTGMRGPIGQGSDARLDVMAYRVALSVSGYQKPIVVDTRQWIDAWAGLAKTQAVWSIR